MRNYFTFSELVVTNTGLPNYPPVFSEVRSNLEKLMTVLDVIRGLVGCPVTVNSAFRSKEVNAAVGGVENSLHLEGRAADIYSPRWATLKSVCKNFHERGILEECIIYDNYIHVAI